tara:strand:+ start:446 stop:1009 length:564 start_codon:yes stop_codon:yes gene_type:complete
MNTQVLDALTALSQIRDNVIKLTSHDPLKNNNWRTMMVVQLLTTEEGLEQTTLEEGTGKRPDATCPGIENIEIKTGLLANPTFDARNMPVYMPKIQCWDMFVYARFKNTDLWPTAIWIIDQPHMGKMKRLLEQRLAKLPLGSGRQTVKTKDIHAAVGVDNVQHITATQIQQIKQRYRLLDTIANADK